jgi:hypothetical protein
MENINLRLFLHYIVTFEDVAIDLLSLIPYSVSFQGWYTPI